MQISGLRHGVKLLKMVEFPVAETLTGGASNEKIQAMLDKYKKIIVKPYFAGGVGKKGKAGLMRIVDNLPDALQAKKDLYFATHVHGGKAVQANGVTYEAFIESEGEVYFSISVSTVDRTPMFTLSPYGGVDIESLGTDKKKICDISPLTGLKSFDLTNALVDLKCPTPYISPLVQHLPKLWDLFNDFGLTTIELNPIRMQRVGTRFLPVACDLKAAFDQDNPGWHRLGLPEAAFQSETTGFETEINQLRTYQGQSDAIELNPNGSIIPFMFGGGANSAATETLGDTAIFSSDFGGNPPYEKMYDISKIVFKHWYDQAEVILIIGGKANNTDIYVTFKGMFDALRDHVAKYGKKPLYVVIGRGGPNLIKGMFYAKDILDTLQIPYRVFGYDTSMILTLEYTKKIEQWWKNKGKAQYIKEFGE
ncbi:MAG: carboxylate--amine ligase [Gammaproteobacteria bacterium]|nr:carboxylate--amine ligase [Gammaproteobacteria bacterium]